MAIGKETWSKVGYGVLAAGVGAALFGGAMHYFLLGNMPAGDFFGLSYSTLLPFVIGALGIFAGYSTKSNDTLSKILLFGGVAAIGFGVADYAGWVVPAARARARARAPAIAYSAPRIYSAPAGSVVPTNGRTKMI